LRGREPGAKTAPRKARTVGPELVASGVRPLDLGAAAASTSDQVVATLGSSLEGLSDSEAQRRLQEVGPNALSSHGPRAAAVLLRQLRNPLLLLLLAAALVSVFVGEGTDALIIFLISGLSIGLGFFNEYRSERAVDALHSRLRHTALVVRDGLGNIDVFFTDKTGTLTEGRITFAAALDAGGRSSDEVLRAGLLCNESVFADGRVVGGNPLDRALWEAPAAADMGTASYRRLATRSFDYARRLASVLVQAPGGRRNIVVKGAPETVLARCREVEPEARNVLEAQFAAGSRVIALATRAADGRSTLRAEDEAELKLAGFLTFHDRPKPDAADALTRLRAPGVEVKVIIGDNDRVAQNVCGELGVNVLGTLTGSQLDQLDDDKLAAALPQTTIFARATPEQKSRVMKAQRRLGTTVGFLGDGVNDTVALHEADVGISVETATDVAKDAADIVLLNKDLEILAGGIVEGRRIFANTIKYVLMGTSSNFGNMFSAGAASLFLNFLPLLPTQILLNNLLYDVSEMTIPTDNVDEKQLERPARWDTTLIRRFMIFFGPISSLFDFATFAILLWAFNAHATLFRSGWFVESLATQSLAIFAIRTRRVPFFRSRPSTLLVAATLVCVAIGVLLPFSPLADSLGFERLPAGLLAALAAMIPTYLLLLELGKRRFYRIQTTGRPIARPRPPRHRRIHDRASRWSIRNPLRRRATVATG
jgi:P-type Mg2+ transporter